MGEGDRRDAEVPLLDSPQSKEGQAVGNGNTELEDVAVAGSDGEISEVGPSSNHGDKSNKRIVSIRANSFCIPHQNAKSRILRLHSFQRTVQVLQLDQSHRWTAIFSWIIGATLLIVVPVLRLRFVRTSSDDSEYDLVFQPCVVVVGLSLSAVSFVFLTQALKRHGLRGVLFLDAADEEMMEVQDEYNTIVEQCRMLLLKLFVPAFMLYAIYRAWFFTAIPLQPLPFETETSAASLSIIIVLMTISWIFETAVYLYSCILFSTVCSLQELKMKKFKGLLDSGYDPEFYYHKYAIVTKGLRATSHRFRDFLALVLSITIIGFFASMYKVVEEERRGTALPMAGEIVILNSVSLLGVGLCLRSASKLSHFHRRITKAAASMHAKLTFETGDLIKFPIEGAASDTTTDVMLQKLSSYFCYQGACLQRAALVNYLSSISAGISVYGFVLDRFFIHASIGVLATTLWFILGRSLID